ncbi:MAG: hypothetical protein K2X44_00220 [Magnetospirillum sp.]|nr:hypothetical protein [Magnetospirillum sp.]
MKTFGHYLLNVLIALDQLANTLACGDPDETISSRLGKAARGDYGADGRKWSAPLRRMVDGVFRLFGQRRHCATSIDADEGKNDLTASPTASAGGGRDVPASQTARGHLA